MSAALKPVVNKPVVNKPVVKLPLFKSRLVMAGLLLASSAQGQTGASTGLGPVSGASGGQITMPVERPVSDATAPGRVVPQPAPVPSIGPLRVLSLMTPAQLTQLKRALVLWNAGQDTALSQLGPLRAALAQLALARRSGRVLDDSELQRLIDQFLAGRTQPRFNEGSGTPGGSGAPGGGQTQPVEPPQVGTPDVAPIADQLTSDALRVAMSSLLSGKLDFNSMGDELASSLSAQILARQVGQRLADQTLQQAIDRWLSAGGRVPVPQLSAVEVATLRAELARSSGQLSDLAAQLVAARRSGAALPDPTLQSLVDEWIRRVPTSTIGPGGSLGWQPSLGWSALSSAASRVLAGERLSSLDSALQSQLATALELRRMGSPITDTGVRNLLDQLIARGVTLQAPALSPDQLFDRLNAAERQTLLTVLDRLSAGDSAAAAQLSPSLRDVLSQLLKARAGGQSLLDARMQQLLDQLIARAPGGLLSGGLFSGVIPGSVLAPSLGGNLQAPSDLLDRLIAGQSSLTADGQRLLLQLMADRERAVQGMSPATAALLNALLAARVQGRAATDNDLRQLIGTLLPGVQVADLDLKGVLAAAAKAFDRTVVVPTAEAALKNLQDAGAGSAPSGGSAAGQVSTSGSSLMQRLLVWIMMKLFDFGIPKLLSEGGIFKLISSARGDVTVVGGLPTNDMVAALRQAASRGAQINVMAPAESAQAQQWAQLGFKVSALPWSDAATRVMLDGRAAITDLKPGQSAYVINSKVAAQTMKQALTEAMKAARGASVQGDAEGIPDTLPLDSSAGAP